MVRTRIAPSPTGDPHVGTAYVALFNYALAKQHGIYEGYVNLRVSYLPPEACERLIERPTPDFPLNYHPDVVAQVVHQTHGQPLLVQRICQEVVNQVNHELFDLELPREARVLPGDLDAVLTDEFVRGETRYFDGIWDQVTRQPGADRVLDALARGPAAVDDLAAAVGLPADEVRQLLDYLERRDLVKQDDAGRWQLLVPLMERWLRLRAEAG